MNYLAHLYLAGENPNLRVGGFLADFIKGPLDGGYPIEIELGMRLHRRIDFWSDQHPSIRQIRALLPAEFSRYVGIIADVLGDHFLSKHWNSYCTLPIANFAEKQIALLGSHSHLFPEKAVWTFDRMSQGSWLTNYHRLPYCVGALSRIGQRLKRENPMHLLAGPITENYDRLEELCTDILVDLEKDVAKWLSEHLR